MRCFLNIVLHNLERRGVNKDSVRRGVNLFLTPVSIKKIIFYIFLLMVIMDMENGDQVTKRGCLCPKDSRGGGG